MEKDSKIFVAGARGLVGSALVRELRTQRYDNLLTPSHAEADLSDASFVRWYFSVHQPDYVFLCAAKVGGIKANAENPLKFFLENLAIETNVIGAASDYNVKKLVFLGSSCIYPKHCPQPIKEEYLLTGPIESTTEPYALAKICGVRLCQWYQREYGDRFVSAMPCNLFGPRDNFDPHNAHVIPGMMARMHQAKLDGAIAFEVWGSGEQTREFLYAEDLARALVLVMQRYEGPEPINTGSSFELTIKDLAILMAAVVEYDGELVFNSAQPTGTPRKVLENSKIHRLGWSPIVPFLQALRTTYEWYKLDTTSR